MYCALIKDYITEICLKLKHTANSVQELNDLLREYKGDLDDAAHALKSIAEYNGLAPFTDVEEILGKYKTALGENRKKFEEYVGSLGKKETADYAKHVLHSISWNAYKKHIDDLSDSLFHAETSHPGEATELIIIIKEYEWLRTNFPDDTYCDVPGLCKIAYTTNKAQGELEGISIESKGWSLTPGAYVGVAPVEDDGVDFQSRMKEIHAELLELQAKSNELMATISENMEEMGL